MDIRDMESSMAQMKADMAQMKADMAQMGSDANYRTALLQEYGLPSPLTQRIHPVWGQELREATQEEWRWAIESGPLFPWEHEARWFVMEDLEAEQAASGDPSYLAHQAIIAGLEDAAREPM